MRQATLSPAPAIGEDWSHYLPGFTLTHTVHLVSSLNLGVVSTAAAVLDGEKVAVDCWAVTRCGDILEQRIVLSDMTERQAVRLRERLAMLDGVLRSRMEHHFVRARSADRESVAG
jgi:hypothetical protein